MQHGQDEKKWKTGQLYLLDKIKWGDDALGAALSVYTGSVNANKQGRQWARTLTWVENIMFGLGRHYIDEVLASRITRDSSGNLSLNENMRRRVPQPTNDLLGRYIETNISILTENRPIPRITAKSDSLEDRHEATLSELTMEYLWEELDLPEKHREIARLVLYTGIAFLEVCYDPLEVRHMLIPDQVTEPTTPIGPGVTAPVPRRVFRIDPRTGAPGYSQAETYGDIVANVVSAFELYIPNDHDWKRGDVDTGWIMREYYMPIEALKSRYLHNGVSSVVTKRNGYFREHIEKVASSNVQNYPLWWWERMADIVEGPHNIPYMGAPDVYDDFTVVRVFDRKPNPDWPRGRTVITAGDLVIYDSPKSRGARVYDPRWPHRWHPYVRYRGEGMVGSIYGRSLVTKLLPFLKRVNSIDATAIMYRRCVPIAQWIMPTGSGPVEGLHCFPGVTIVATSLGAKRIRDIQVGDRVLSREGYATVLAVHENGLRSQFVHIRAYKHSDVYMTSNHIVPIVRDAVEIEVPAGEIRKGDHLVRECRRSRTEPKTIDLVDFLDCVEEIRSSSGLRVRRYDSHQGGMPCSLPTSANVELDPDFLWVLGLYAAEGCSSRGRLHFCLGSHETYLSDRLLSIINKKFGLVGVIRRRASKPGVMVVEFANVVLQRFVTKLIPGTARIKTLHQTLFDNVTSLLPVVAGWMDGDGCRNVHHGCVNFGGTTASPALALQLQQIALEEGLLASRYRSERAEGTYWLINFSDDCAPMTDHSVRFFGKVGPRQQAGAKFEGHRWLFRVTRDPQIREHETQPVYDLTTDVGYYNVQGFLVHNSGEPGQIIKYDPARTGKNEPKPVYPQPYPAQLLQEREMMIQQMENVAGTELVLKGERPTGVTSAAMLGLMRNQALASRSPTLQAWDESLQLCGSALLQETKKHIGEDETYRRRIMILARDKASQFSIDNFAGTMIADNVNVKIDTMSMALLSREAKQQRAIEVFQYAPGLVQLPAPVQAKLMEELGWPDLFIPKGEDVSRARMLIQFCKSKRFDLAIPMPEDDPYTIHEMLVAEIKGESALNYETDVLMAMYQLIGHYRDTIQRIEQAKMQMQMQMMQMGAAPAA